MPFTGKATYTAGHVDVVQPTLEHSDAGGTWNGEWMALKETYMKNGSCSVPRASMASSTVSLTT